MDAIGGARGGEGDNEVSRTMLEIVNQLDGFESRGNVKVSAMENWEKYQGHGWRSAKLMDLSFD